VDTVMLYRHNIVGVKWVNVMDVLNLNSMINQVFIKLFIIIVFYFSISNIQYSEYSEYFNTGLKSIGKNVRVA